MKRFSALLLSGAVALSAEAHTQSKKYTIDLVVNNDTFLDRKFEISAVSYNDDTRRHDVYRISNDMKAQAIFMPIGFQVGGQIELYVRQCSQGRRCESAARSINPENGTKIYINLAYNGVPDIRQVKIKSTRPSLSD